jgi:CheY-like chemotaxis protein
MYNILVVEDNLADQKYFHAVLHQFFEIEIVNSRAEAIRIIELKLFDLVLMDYTMSLVDEVNIIAILREALFRMNRNIPILILADDSSTTDREYCLMSGANDYLQKPISPMDLIDAVRFHLK